MTHERPLPIMAITLGDPAGIGPEICVDTMLDKSMYEVSRPFLIGNRKAMEKAAAIKGVTLNIHEITAPEEALFEHGTIDLLDPGVESDADIAYGEVQKVAAEVEADRMDG